MNAPVAAGSLVDADGRMELAPPLLLRVLSGRSKGAEVRLPQGRLVSVGHGFESDVVLRDRASKGCAVSLSTSGRRATLKVVSGTVTVLGRALEAGEWLILEPYLPVRLGDMHFALGWGDEERWTEASQGILEDADEADGALAEALPMDIAERLDVRSQPARSRVAAISIRPLWVGLAGSALLALAVAAWFGSSMMAQGRSDPAALSTQLAGAGFGDLSVEVQDTGRLAIVGLVDGERNLVRLREWALANRPDALLDVDTMDGAAAAASDLLAGQNVDAVARADGAHRLVVEGPFLPGDRQQELSELIKRDLPRIRQVEFRADPARGDQDLAYFFNAPGYGAASFVEGDPGYLVTEDGTRWFAGAVLPTGHKIIEIGANRMTVERDGLRDTLVM